MSAFTDYISALPVAPVRWFRNLSGTDLVDSTGTVANQAATGTVSQAALPVIANDTTRGMTCAAGGWVYSSANSPKITGNLTMISIVRLRSTQLASNTNRARIMVCSDGTGSTSEANNFLYQLEVYNDNGTRQIRCFHETGSGTGQIVVVGEALVDQVMVLVARRDVTANTYQATINGVHNNAVEYTHGDPTGGGSGFLVISGQNATSQQWPGILGDTLIFDYALSDEQVEALSAAALGTPGTVIDTQTNLRYSITPNQRGIFHDGNGYAAMYPKAQQMTVRYGADVAALSTHTADLPDDINSEGLACAMHVGIDESGDLRMWAGASREANEGINVYSAELSTTAGLGTVTSRSIAKAVGSFNYVHLSPGYASGVVEHLYYGTMERGSPQTASVMGMHRLPAALDGDGTSGGTWNPSVLGSPNWSPFFALEDGYLQFATDSGGAGGADGNVPGAQEITMPTVGGSQTASAELGMTDQAYAPATTPQLHSSVVAVIQQRYTGYIWTAYKDATDAKYGKVVLKRRGPRVADTWGTVSLDTVGASVWHLALTQSIDGSRLFLAYVKNEGSNQRGRRIYWREINATAGTVGAEQTFADVRGAYEIDAIVAPPYVVGTTLPLLYSEHDGSIVGGTGTGGSTWYMVATATISPTQDARIDASVIAAVSDATPIVVHNTTLSQLVPTGSWPAGTAIDGIAGPHVDYEFPALSPGDSFQCVITGLRPSPSGSPYSIGFNGVTHSLRIKPARRRLPSPSSVGPSIGVLQ